MKFYLASLNMHCVVMSRMLLWAFLISVHGKLWDPNQYCVIGFHYSGLIPAGCQVALDASLVWTGDQVFGQQLASAAVKHSTTADSLLAVYGKDVDLHIVANLTQGLFIQPATSLGVEVSCFPSVICTVTVIWQEGKGWSTGSDFMEVQRASWSLPLTHFKREQHSLRFQIAFAGRSRVSIWTKQVSWYLAYTSIRTRLVGKYPEATATKNIKILDPFKDTSTPSLIFGYTVNLID